VIKKWGERKGRKGGHFEEGGEGKGSLSPLYAFNSFSTHKGGKRKEEKEQKSREKEGEKDTVLR